MSDTQIYHNNRCSKSRETLALLQAEGIEPEIIQYLREPPTPAALTLLLEQLGIGPSELIRKGEALYKEQQLNQPDVTDDQLIAAMCKHPKLIQRPIVVHGGKAALGRPPEQVLALFS